MGILDFFKKKSPKPEYDVTNIEVIDLTVGFIFDYDLSTWEVQETYEYDWGNECFSFEFKISDGNRVLYLSLEDDDGVCLSVTEKIGIRVIGEDIPEFISENQKPPSKITYNGTSYFLDCESPGYFQKQGATEWSELVSWNYEDKQEEAILCIERWGDFEFDAAIGKYIEEYEISNIMPKGNN